MTYSYNRRAISMLLTFALLLSMLPSGILPVYTTAAEVSDSDYTAAEKRTAEFNGYFPVPVSDEPSAVSDPFGTDCQQLQQSEVTDGLLLVIDKAYYNADTDCLWYRVEAAPGYTLPAKLSAYPWVFQDYVKNPMGASLLIHEPPCLEHSESGVRVTADETLPVGASLHVETADVSSQLAQYGVDSSKLVFGLDIQVLNGDSSQWQPEKGVTVKVPVSAAPGTTIGLLHTHDGKTSYLGATVVLSDGTVEFFAEGFSAFAGFTVDFHYNDIDYSIAGLTDILLSELFTVLEIDRNAAHAIDVVFSDPTLVSVTRQDSDWLLTSLQAFDTEETLTITFADGEIIVIDVTDARYVDYIWDLGEGSIAYVFYDMDWNSVTNRTDFYLYTGTDYPVSHNSDTSHGEGRVPVSAAGYSKLYITNKGNYWYHGTAENCSAFYVDDEYNFVIKASKSSGDVVRIDRIYRGLIEIKNKATITQKRFSAANGNVKQRTVVLRVNGKTDTTVKKYFPTCAGQEYSQLDVQYIPSLSYFYGDYENLVECGKDTNGQYEDTSGKYYTYTGGYEGTYTVDLYTKYKVVFDPNGATSGSMSNQTFVWGKEPNLTANDYARNYTVTYIPNGGSLSSTSATAKATFNGWATSATGSKVYNDEHPVSKWTETPNGTVTLYANWTLASVTLPTPTAPAGHTFGGWYSDAAFKNKVGDAGAIYTPTSNITLYAKWTCTITYNANEGSGAPADQTKTYGVNLTLSSTQPTRTGYTFTGWNTKADGSGTSYAAGGTYSANAAATLYAQWSANPNTAYKVQHWQQKVNGGTEQNSTNYTLVTSDTQNLTGTTGASVTPAVKSYTGFTSPSAKTVTIAADGSTVVNYYYNRVKYTVAYDANNGSGAPSNQTKTYGADLTLSSTQPTRTGYTFTGWNTKADGSGTSYAAGGTYSANAAATLYAQWSANPNTAYKVQHWQQKVDGGSDKNSTNYTLVTGDTQNLTGTTGASVTPAVKSYTGFKSPSTQTVTIAADGSTVVNYYYDRESYTVTVNKGTGISFVTGAGSYRYGASVTITATVSDGYNWSGWTGTHSTTDSSYTFTMPASNVTDTANATIKTYQVTYHGNGSTGGSTGPQTFNHGSTVTIAANGFTKTGYHFTGWNTKADGSGTKYAANAVYSTNANLTLYAQWEINTYTVTYVLGFDGIANITTNASAFPVQTKTYDVDLTLHSGTEPTATGYKFLRWNTKADGSGTPYAPGDVYDTDANLILYAQWDPTPYTVTYVINGLPADKASVFTDQCGPINTEIELHKHSFDGYERISITAATNTDGEVVAVSDDGKITIPGDHVTVTITFKTIDYKITYSGLDGAEVIGNPITYTVEDTITLNNPTKEGYDFAGWTGTELSGATKTVTIPAGSIGDRAYTATWSEKTYTVTYYPNNGSGAVAVDSFVHGGSVRITDNNFDNGSSKFVRWNTMSDGSGQDYEPGAVYSTNADLDLYAVWGYELTVNVYSVVDGVNLLEGEITYHGESWGSTATAIWPANSLTGQSLVFSSAEDRIICAVKMVVNGTTIVDEAVNNECPYTFIHTFTNALTEDTTVDVYFYALRVSMNAEIDRGSVYCTVAGDSTLYPWETVQCNPGEHKGASVIFVPASGYSITAVTINDETDTNPTLNADGSYTYEIGVDGITENTTIEVTTTLNGYTITYNLDGGSEVPENPTAYDVTSPAITLVNPTKEGYTFAGWTGTGLNGATMKVTIPTGSTGNRTYTATWTINQYTLSGVIENGTATSHTVNYLEKATINFTADVGYRMTGWQTSEGESGTFDTLTQYEWQYDLDAMDSDVVVTVFTVPIDYTITYSGLEGATVEANLSTYNIKSATFTLNNPSKPGYTFAGWIGTGLSKPTMEVTILTGSIGDRQYTATWTENKVTIQYVAVGPNGVTNFGSVSPTAQTVGVVTGEPSSTASVSSNVYKFVGWYDKDGNLLSKNATYTPAKVDGFHVAATYTAKFEYNLTSLTIEKGGWNRADANQTFLFRVQGVNDGVDLTVTIQGDGSVTIDGLTVGYQYIITELTDWSWRYHTTGWTHGTESGTGSSATITIGVQGKIIFANNRDAFMWLDGDSWLDNLFSGN